MINYKTYDNYKKISSYHYINFQNGAFNNFKKNKIIIIFDLKKIYGYIYLII